MFLSELLRGVNRYLISFTNYLNGLLKSNVTAFIVSSNNTVFFFLVFLITWVFEWAFVFHITLDVHSYLSYTTPYRVSFLLVIIFIFFIHTWIIAVWRRANYGKFTRGDRELWAKGFASFWFFEISTLVGFLIAAAWMNWGPSPLFSRKFNISRQSFLFEVVIFTYIVFLLNLMRIAIKLNDYETQIIYVIAVLLILSLLVWRDLLVLIGRDSITLSEGSRWRLIDSRITIYTLSSSMWVNHYLTHIDKSNNFTDPSNYTLSEFLDLLDKGETDDIFKKQSTNSLYNSYQSVVLPHMNADNLILNFHDRIFYPKRVGFFNKRISMWTFFLFLKIWHHFMLIIWWYYYLLRLYTTKKTSNIFIAVCSFNTYCCFLIILSIYIFCLFPKFVVIFRIFKDRPRMLNYDVFYGWKNYIPDYIYSLLISFKTRDFNIYTTDAALYTARSNPDFLIIENQNSSELLWSDRHLYL